MLNPALASLFKLVIELMISSENLFNVVFCERPQKRSLISFGKTIAMAVVICSFQVGFIRDA